MMNTIGTDTGTSYKITLEGYNVVSTKDKNATVVYDVTFSVKQLSNSQQQPDRILFSLSGGKRYSEFRDLYKTVSSIPEPGTSSSPREGSSHHFKYDFPSKMFFGNTNVDNIEKRKNELQLFCDQLTQQLIKESRLVGTSGELYGAILKFFEVNGQHHI